MKRVLSLLQMLQLAASPLQFIDLLLELFETLVRSPLCCFLLLLDLIREQSLVSLNGASHHGDNLSTCLYFPLFIYLQISINQCQYTVRLLQISTPCRMRLHERTAFGLDHHFKQCPLLSLSASKNSQLNSQALSQLKTKSMNSVIQAVFRKKYWIWGQKVLKVHPLVGLMTFLVHKNVIK